MSELCKKLALVITLTAMSFPAFADHQFRSKFGFDARGVKLPQQTGVGWLAGLQTGRYFGSSNVFYGLGGLFGAPTGDSLANEMLYYGGFTLGYDGRMSKYFIFDLQLLAGYGGGHITRVSQDNLSYYVVEPSAGIGVSLGGGFRLKLACGYTHMTNTPNFSGFTFGFRIDFRSAVTSKDIND